jgi:hypothetical protein
MIPAAKPEFNQSEIADRYYLVDLYEAGAAP